MKALKKQRIDGRSLAYLTLDHLLKFGIAFGVAVRLVSCLDDLIPNRTELLNHEEDTGDELLPSWYVSNDGTGKSHNKRTNQLANNEYESYSAGKQELEMTERAQTIMKERFGMSLPTPRGQDVGNHSDEEAQANIPNQNQPYPIEKPMQSTVSDIDNRTLGEASIGESTQPVVQHPTNIEAMLNAMPPHIRGVAERRPDLVSKLLLEKQQQFHNLQTSAQTEDDRDYPSEDPMSVDPESVSLL
eukprot:CAMPEP_0183730002 /NCGR_PEP_ID=MMETSP0737-20130205/31720_1 /TAXON_ID=385413 /ORGANISM="Thalassiosira miniscula, Strain CCMP1093" /LENGTH=243 /DNA_ID=CAMNT_0025962353 /DNA_START=528 /DNA_END=1256 /DNA_ORIENTATION=+